MIKIEGLLLILSSYLYHRRILHPLNWFSRIKLNEVKLPWLVPKHAIKKFLISLNCSKLENKISHIIFALSKSHKIDSTNRLPASNSLELMCEEVNMFLKSLKLYSQYLSSLPQNLSYFFIVDFGSPTPDPMYGMKKHDMLEIDLMLSKLDKKKIGGFQCRESKLEVYIYSKSFMVPSEDISNCVQRNLSNEKAETETESEGEVVEESLLNENGQADITFCEIIPPSPVPDAHHPITSSISSTNGSKNVKAVEVNERDADPRRNRRRTERFNFVPDPSQIAVSPFSSSVSNQSRPCNGIILKRRRKNSSKLKKLMELKENYHYCQTCESKLKVIYGRNGYILTGTISKHIKSKKHQNALKFKKQSCQSSASSTMSPPPESNPSPEPKKKQRKRKE
uniref:Uncharacterized protein n=1 Tax=Panagrolaimus sp. PS1159 TaxID=55785 RepID=A0AC35F272_9BILA